MNLRRIYRPKQRALSVVSAVVAIVLAIVTINLASMASNSVRQRAASNFDWASQQVSTRVQNTLNSYANNLYAGRSFMLNSQVVTASEWAGFYHNQDIFNRFQGMNSIFYVQLIPQAQKNSFLATARTQPEFGSNFNINPAGDRDIYAIATLIVSKNDVPLSGFDLYSTADRRSVYETAQSTGAPTASGVYTFAGGQEGMVIALPVNRTDSQGFVVTALYSKDFFPSVVDPNGLGPLSLKITDVTDQNKPQVLYKAGGWTDGNSILAKSDSLSFGNRTWQIDYHAIASATQNNVLQIVPYLIMAVGLLLIGVLLMGLFILFEIAPRKRAERNKLDRKDDY